MRNHLADKAVFNRREVELEKRLTIACNLLIELGMEPDVVKFTIAERLDNFE